MKNIPSRFPCAVPFFCAVLLAACLGQGPENTLNKAADALERNDSAAFMAQLDMSAFAASQIKNLTREDNALRSLDSLGRMLGLGGMEDLIGSVFNMEKRLQEEFVRGVSSGELPAACRKATTPDCPWVPESLRKASVIKLDDSAAVARVSTPEKITSWLALRRKGDAWLVVGQAPLEETARAHARKPAAASPEGGGARGGQSDEGVTNL